MTDKEFRRLRRLDLIDIIYRLQKREQELLKEIDALKAQLADKELKISEAGSIAEAALQLNGVFEAAQAAADQYVEQVRLLHDGKGTEQDETSPETSSDDTDTQADTPEE